MLLHRMRRDKGKAGRMSEFDSMESIIDRAPSKNNDTVDPECAAAHTGRKGSLSLDKNIESIMIIECRELRLRREREGAGDLET